MTGLMAGTRIVGAEWILLAEQRCDLALANEMRHDVGDLSSRMALALS
jgi:hypothetical protein